MEQIIKEINNEIKKVTSLEVIDLGKLRELINMKERLKNYSVTSLNQVREFNNQIPTMPVPSFEQARQNTVYDSLKNMFELFLKNQTKQIESKDEIKIDELIQWYIFLDKIQTYLSELYDEDTYNTKSDLYVKIVKLIREKLNKKDNKEKDEIINTTL